MNRAHIFKQKAVERRQSVAVEKTLPSGLQAKLCRPSLEVWLMTGRIPQAFTKKVLELTENGQTKPATSEVLKRLTGGDLAASLIFVRDFVRETLVSPVIVTDRAPDYDRDEIAPTDMEEADFLWIFQWAISGSPDIPVELKGGKETSVGALGRFSRKRARARSGADK